MTKEMLHQLVEETCLRMFGCELREATEKQAYRALCVTVRMMLEDKQRAFQAETKEKERKQVYYMSMEFLVGTSLRNNLFNLGLYSEADEVLKELGFSLPKLCEMEPDAGLGNGGLGRLASCYMDAATGLEYPVTGFSIRYEFGIFKQKIVDGWQMEFPDNWLEMGDVWLQAREDDAVEVKFGGEVREWMDNDRFKVAQVGYSSVMAVPYDMCISGYDSDAANRLVLWSAKLPQSFDMAAFSRGDYVRALERNAMAETISKVLYPADDHINGKRLRLRQQYFLSAASIGDIVQNHLATYGTLENLGDKVAIQLNDTHPTLAIPEMMRILLDECGFGWDKSFDICQKVFAYTNHTVMAEALEKWNVDIFKMTLPRIYQIVVEMNRRAREELEKVFPGDEGKINYMALIGDNQVRMANICAYTSHSINGVSKLHSEIIKDSVFHDYYLFKPKAFKNVTNGIAYRRWLLASNPELCKLLDETIGDGYKHDAADLSKLNKYADDKTVLKKLNEIKLDNKKNFAAYLEKSTGQSIDPNSIFDCQVKRMHEYKRQLLNGLHILSTYQWLRENPNADFTPKTYFFGAKAAPGYYFAKEIIRFIAELGEAINKDPAMKDKLKVIYLEDYRVTVSEILNPAAEISQQISLAGTEASGTSNMKLMINGAITLGTLDGANVEIHEAVGSENMFLFGMTTPEVNLLRQNGYNPYLCYNNNPALKKAIDEMSVSGFNGMKFEKITQNLLSTDRYMVLADYSDYAAVQEKASQVYKDQTAWNRMSLVNIAQAGRFAADRAIREYARDIWGASPVKGEITR